MKRRTFLATTFGTLALPFHARAQDDDPIFALGNMIRDNKTDFAAFQKAFSETKNLDINTTSYNFPLLYPEGFIKQEDTLLSVAFMAQMEITDSDGIALRWNPEREKIIDFLLENKANINQNLSGKSYGPPPREDGMVITRIFDRIATQALDAKLLEAAFKRGALPTDFIKVALQLRKTGAAYNYWHEMGLKDPKKYSGYELAGKYEDRCVALIDFFVKNKTNLRNRPNIARSKTGHLTHAPHA